MWDKADPTKFTAPVTTVHVSSNRIDGAHLNFHSKARTTNMCRWEHSFVMSPEDEAGRGGVHSQSIRSSTVAAVWTGGDKAADIERHGLECLESVNRVLGTDTNLATEIRDGMRTFVIERRPRGKRVKLDSGNEVQLVEFVTPKDGAALKEGNGSDEFSGDKQHPHSTVTKGARLLFNVDKGLPATVAPTNKFAQNMAPHMTGDDGSIRQVLVRLVQQHRTVPEASVQLPLGAFTEEINRMSEAWLQETVPKTRAEIFARSLTGLRCVDVSAVHPTHPEASMLHRQMVDTVAAKIMNGMRAAGPSPYAKQHLNQPKRNIMGRGAEVESHCGFHGSQSTDINGKKLPLAGEIANQMQPGNADNLSHWHRVGKSHCYRFNLPFAGDNTLQVSGLGAGEAVELLLDDDMRSVYRPSPEFIRKNGPVFADAEGDRDDVEDLFVLTGEVFRDSIQGLASQDVQQHRDAVQDFTAIRFVTAGVEGAMAGPANRKALAKALKPSMFASYCPAVSQPLLQCLDLGVFSRAYWSTEMLEEMHAFDHKNLRYGAFDSANTEGMAKEMMHMLACRELDKQTYAQMSAAAAERAAAREQGQKRARAPPVSLTKHLRPLTVPAKVDPSEYVEENPAQLLSRTTYTGADTSALAKHKAEMVGNVSARAAPKAPPVSREMTVERVDFITSKDGKESEQFHCAPGGAAKFTVKLAHSTRKLKVLFIDKNRQARGEGACKNDVQYEMAYMRGVSIGRRPHNISMGDGTASCIALDLVALPKSGTETVACRQFRWNTENSAGKMEAGTTDSYEGWTRAASRYPTVRLHVAVTDWDTLKTAISNMEDVEKDRKLWNTTSKPPAAGPLSSFSPPIAGSDSVADRVIDFWDPRLVRATTASNTAGEVQLDAAKPKEDFHPTFRTCHNNLLDLRGWREEAHRWRRLEASDKARHRAAGNVEFAFFYRFKAQCVFCGVVLYICFDGRWRVYSSRFDQPQQRRPHKARRTAEELPFDERLEDELAPDDDHSFCKCLRCHEAFA